MPRSVSWLPTPLLFQMKFPSPWMVMTFLLRLSMIGNMFLVLVVVPWFIHPLFVKNPPPKPITIPNSRGRSTSRARPPRLPPPTKAPAILPKPDAPLNVNLPSSQPDSQVGPIQPPLSLPSPLPLTDPLPPSTTLPINSLPLSHLSPPKDPIPNLNSSSEDFSSSDIPSSSALPLPVSNPSKIRPVFPPSPKSSQNLDSTISTITWQPKQINSSLSPNKFAILEPEEPPDIAVHYSPKSSSNVVESKLDDPPGKSTNYKVNTSNCNNFDHSFPGRIWIKWNPAVVTFIPSFSSSQLIHGCIHYGASKKFLVSVVYAANSLEDRKLLWQDLSSIAVNITSPWVIMGDFNCYKDSNDKSGGSPTHFSHFGELNGWYSSSGTFEFASTGLHYTWFNKRANDPVHVKLDRMIVNQLWFQFKDYWTNMDGYWENVIAAFSVHFGGSPICNLYGKLKDLKILLKKRSWADSSFIMNKISATEKRQSHLLYLISGNPLDSNLNDNLKDIANAAVSYFKKIYNTPVPSCPNISSFPPGSVIPSHLIQPLIAPITNDEIKSVVFSGPNSSSPGPDGFSFTFYKRSWEVIGFYVCNAVKHFFSSGQLPSAAKATGIVLIPKHSHASNISDYRPISLCNVLYKIIAKILAIRLKEVLPFIIHKSQAGFISKRISSDNIVLAADILRTFNVERVNKFLCAKLDIKKAFDIVSREFLLQRLAIKGFPEQFITWIKGCIMDVPFSVIINGTLEGFFKSSSGLRQDCPLSPLLFTVVMDAFSSALEEGSFKGISCGSMNFSHLLYADDVLVFGEASLQNAMDLKDTLNNFAASTGLYINDNKSSILFSSNTTAAHDISNLLGFSLADHSISYLGRIQYLKFTIANTITYWIRGAILPKCCCKVIDKLCSKFLYHGTSFGKKLHLISWKKTCLPTEMGGLGIPDIHSLSFGYSCSFIWRFYSSNSLPGDWFRLRNSSPLKPPTAKASKFWTFTCKTATRLKQNLKFVVTRYNCIMDSIWDPWINGVAGYELMHSTVSGYSAVKNLIVDGFWDLFGYTLSGISHIISSIPILDNHLDCVEWTGVGKLCFKTFRKLFYSAVEKVNWSIFIWHKRSALKYSSYGWLAVCDGVSTADNLRKRNIFINSTCHLCGKVDESILHMFLPKRNFVFWSFAALSTIFGGKEMLDVLKGFRKTISPSVTRSLMRLRSKRNAGNFWISCNSSSHNASFSINVYILMDFKGNDDWDRLLTPPPLDGQGSFVPSLAIGWALTASAITSILFALATVACPVLLLMGALSYSIYMQFCYWDRSHFS
ncbi:uncharacterized protein LOC110106006 [Dendrobium catenatum]|uniref:uncharacterized protein LOC110106006 n=1 Tax=Dendrobium catenatum TaxID=906689 RepID=UPI0009F30C15|nr:uncharacterized protein LOC110106006 [Dendrobium catenatum]